MHSLHQHEQDKTVFSCLVRVGGVNCVLRYQTTEFASIYVGLKSAHAKKFSTSDMLFSHCSFFNINTAVFRYN